MINLLGWIGVLCILTAFTLTTFSIISPKDLVYGALNLIGSLGIIVSSLAKRDLQPVTLNSIWLIVACIGIIRSFMA